MSIGVVLFLIFLVLKLIDQLDWSWWWVVSPILAEVGIAILWLTFGGILVTIGSWADRRDRKRLEKWRKRVG